MDIRFHDWSILTLTLWKIKRRNFIWTCRIWKIPSYWTCLYSFCIRTRNEKIFLIKMVIAINGKLTPIYHNLHILYKRSLVIRKKEFLYWLKKTITRDFLLIFGTSTQVWWQQNEIREIDCQRSGIVTWYLNYQHHLIKIQINNENYK